MQSDDVLRPRRLRRYRVDVEVGSIGGEDRALFDDAVEIAKQAALDLHILEHRLDDQIGLGQGDKVERAGQPGHARLDLLLRQLALFGARLVSAADSQHAALKSVRFGLDNRHRQAGVEEIHCNAAAHRAGADDPDFFDAPRRRIRRETGDFADLPFGGEDITQGLRLATGFQAQENLPFARQPGVEWQVDGGLHGFDRLFPGDLAAIFPRMIFPRLREDFSGGFNLFIAQSAQGRAARDQLASEILRFRRQRSVAGQGVDRAVGEGLLRGNGRAGQDHVQRLFHADEAWQALRAAAARNQAELDFGQAEFRARRRYAIMRRQRDFQPAAERSAIQRRDHRHFGVFYRRQHISQGRRDGRLVEFRDIGAGDEGLAGADQHECANVRIGAGHFDAALDPLAHRRRQGVDRRRVEGERRDLAVESQSGDRIDMRH